MPAIWSMRNKSAEHIDQTLLRSTQTAKDGLSSVLSAQQLKRIDEIQLWVLGMKAFLRDDFAARLELNDDQRRKISKTMQETHKSITRLNQDLQDGESSKELRKRAQQLRVDEQKEILSIISDTQKKRWVAALGRRIEVSKLGRVRFKAPQLQTEDGWINSQPLTLEQLKGKVIALHFYAFA